MDVYEQILASLPDLNDRWKRSRVGAIAKVVPIESEDLFLSSLDSYTEEEYEEVLKGIFIHSNQLGKSYANHMRLVWGRSDFKKYLMYLTSPCLKGTWESKKSADVLTREGCSEGKIRGSRYCRYWREAIDGLVLGLSDEVSYARHSTITSGDSFCSDLFYDDENTLTSAMWSNQNRWGELPVQMIPDLDFLKMNFKKLGVELDFLGVKENHLYYKLESKTKLTCGSIGQVYRQMLEKKTSELFPALRLKDASPVAVYGVKS